jgi:hypothetical protein
MGGDERIVKGVVRNGVIVLAGGEALPEGAEVTVTIHPAPPGSEDEVAELSAEAIREADQWERQE